MKHSSRPRSLSVSPALFSVVLGALWVVAGGPAFGAVYDPPNFDQPVIEVDALSLERRPREELAAALTALASNFPGEALVDSDLREKALALALTLCPLDPGARAAHRKLSIGREPGEVDYFSTLDSVSEILWEYAAKLNAREAEPEDRRLAPMLMEVSLLIQPDDELSTSHLLAFQKAAEAAPLNWARIVTLQTDVNPSNARAIALWRPIIDPTMPDTTGSTPPPDPDTPKPVPMPGDAPPEAPVSEIQIAEAALTYLGRDETNGEAAAGVARLTVREPTVDENSLFGLFVESGTKPGFEMRLTEDDEGPSLAGIDLAGSFIRKRYPVWPPKRFGEFTFQASAGHEPPEEIDLGLPALVLLGSAFSGEPILEAFTPAREFALAGLLSPEGRPVLPDGAGAAEYIHAAMAMPIPPKVLFVPDGKGRAETGLLEAAASGDLEILVRPQVVTYETLEDLRPLVFGKEVPGELTEAMEEFATVQSLTEKMEIGEIARNGVVQERLRGILAKWPSHLSAKVLLAHGAKPADLVMSPQAVVAKVDKLLNPLSDYYEQLISGTGRVFDGSIDDAVEGVEKSLFDLRSKIDPAARRYVFAAEETLDAYKIYLSLRNPGSSIGKQRLRELQEQIAALQAEGRKLGAGGASP